MRDEVLGLRWVYSSLHSKAPLKWKPDPLPRPGVAVKGKRRPKVDSDEAHAQAEMLWAHLQQLDRP